MILISLVLIYIQIFITKGYFHILLLLIITEKLHAFILYKQLNEALSTLPLFLEKLLKLGG